MAINTIPAGADFTYVNGQSDLRRVSRRIDTIGAFVRNTAACSVVSDIITIPVAASNNDVEVIDSRNTKFIPANSLVTSIGIFFTELCDVGASGVLKVGFGPTTGDESIVGQTTLNGAGNDVTINSFISTSNGAVASTGGTAGGLVIKTGAANRLSVGISKKPCIWPACRSIVKILSAPALVIRFATSLAEIGVLGPDFLSCLA